MKIPNIITLSRLVLVAIAFTMLALHPLRPEVPRNEWWGDAVIFGFLFFAAVTDFVDGYVARRFGQTSMLGRVLDPFADKVLICGTAVLFIEIPALSPWVPAWLVVILISREFLVQSLRGIAEAKGISFPADTLGKWKMLAQCVWILGLASYQAGWDWPVGFQIVPVAMWVTLVLTIVSGLHYLRKAWRALDF